MKSKYRVRERKNHVITILVIILTFTISKQCYGSEGIKEVSYYKNLSVISGKFIFYQNVLFVILSIVVICLLAALAIIINKYVQLKRKHKDLLTKEKIQTDYIIIISHELRTPLNIIINSAKLLNKYISSNDDLNKQYVMDKSKYIVKNSSRLLKTINNSIDAAMFESGVVNVHFENHNIVEAIEDIITASQEYAQSHNISLIFDPQEEEIITAIDRCKIERVMLNLISNSIKNIRGEGNILVTCERKSNMIHIKVTDDGIGMSEYTQKHLFDKFYQASTDILNRSNEGSGLGMYITYNLVKIHGGDMTVDSEIGNGTTITISLPIKITDNRSNDDINKFECDSREKARIEFSDLYR